MTSPLVSIVTPSYNQGRFIRATIASVLSQEYSPIEYLVIDGGSSDQTVEVLRNYQNRFYWVSEKDKGQSQAINKGWARARGEILAWLNSDDLYLPGAVSKAVHFLERHPDIGAVYGEGYHIAMDGGIIERYPTEPFDRQRLRETCYICQPTVFIRRSILEKVGALDENLQYCMDYDLWFRIVQKFDFGFLPEYLACTRFYEETKTLGLKIQVHKEILKVVRRYHPTVPASWVYGYGHAFCEKYFDRSQRVGNFFFVAGLIGVSCLKFMQYNHRVPIAEWRRWRQWIENHFRWQKLHRPSPEGNAPVKIFSK